MKFLHTLSKSGLLVALLMLLASAAWSQRTVRGKVTDAESGEALIGATVSVVGTTRGTTTDIDGNYTIPLKFRMARSSCVLPTRATPK